MDKLDQAEQALRILWGSRHNRYFAPTRAEVSSAVQAVRIAREAVRDARREVRSCRLAA